MTGVPHENTSASEKHEVLDLVSALQKESDDRAKRIAEWLRSADAGAVYGSSTWGLRQQLATDIEQGRWVDWRSRVESRY